MGDETECNVGQETLSTDNPVARSARYPFPPVAASGGIMTEVQPVEDCAKIKGVTTGRRG